MAIPTANQYLNASRRINTRIMPNYVSGQRPISPPYTTNLLGWYMADKGVLKAGGAAAANGDAINQVNDQSGNGYNLTVGAGTPIFATGLYNQLPGMVFLDNAYLSNASILGAGNWGGAVGTLHIVYQSLIAGYWAASTGDSTGNWRFAGDGNGYAGEFRSARLTAYPAGMPWQTKTLITVVSGASNYFWRVNRSQASNQATSWAVRAVLTLGGGGSAGMTGIVSEFMIFNAELSAGQIQQNETYLGSKWNV